VVTVPPPLPSTGGGDTPEGYLYVAWYLDHDIKREHPVRYRYGLENLMAAKRVAANLVVENQDIDTLWIYDAHDVNWLTWYRDDKKLIYGTEE